MVIVTPDLTYENNVSAGRALDNILNPPAIYLQLSPEEEVEGSYAIFQGSGGSYTSIFSASPSGAKTQVKINGKSRLAGVVEEICSAFGLTKEEFAQICKIQSRKTLYNWINGEAFPRKTTMSRMYDLLLVAREWKKAGFSGSRENLNSRVVDNKSLLQMLSEEQVDRNLIIFAGSRLSLASPQRAKISDPFA